MIATWKQQARRELIGLRGGSFAWGYRRAHAASAEPTALACLGLLASGDEETSASDIATSQEAAAWLAAIQRSDGSLPVSSRFPSPGWPTPHVILLWSTLPAYLKRRHSACAWLLDFKGKTFARENDPDHIIGHDPSLVGWPWVDGTSSWLEPTALAILALCRAGLIDHPRVSAGIELILDRSLAGGGWNSGSKSVFGTELRPQPAPTGLALLALAARGDRPAAVSRAVAYLRASLGDLRAAVSIGWGVLGLRAHQALPMEAETWLEEAHARCGGKPDAAMGLALLLLASSEPALSLLATPVAGRW